MDLYDSSHITTSSRLTPAEEEEIRSTSGSTEQIRVPSDDSIKTAEVGEVGSSPTASVSPSFQGFSSVVAGSESAKPKMLVPILIVDKSQQQQTSEKQQQQQQQQSSPGRRLIDAGSTDTLQEDIRSQIQASASIDDDMDVATQNQSSYSQQTTTIEQQQQSSSSSSQQQQQQQKSPPGKMPNDRKQHLSKPTSLSIPSSGTTPIILVSASSPSPSTELPSIHSSIISPRIVAATSSSNNNNIGSSGSSGGGGERSSSAVALEPSKPARKKHVEKGQPRGGTPFEIQPSSSSSKGVSIHSNSPAVTSTTSSGGVLQQRRTSSLGSYTSLTTTLVTATGSIQQHPSTSSLTLEAAGPSLPLSSAALDPQYFATVFHELAKSIEQMETLNEQILEKMTLFRPSPTLPPPQQQQSPQPPGPPPHHQQHRPFTLPQAEQRSNSPSSTRALPPSPPPPSQSPLSTTPLDSPPGVTNTSTEIWPPPEEEEDNNQNNEDNNNNDFRRRMKGKARAMNFEEDRQSIAQSFTDLVMDSWPRIYKIPPEPRTPQLRQDRIKTATTLKDAIVTFWSVQSYFQERAELILDVQQNPAVLENGDRFRILRSHHLDNILSQEPLHPFEMERILDRYREQQDLLNTLSEQLQNVWLGILLLLGDPDQTRSKATTTASKLSHHRRLHMDSMQHLNHSAAGSSSSGYSLDYRNLGVDFGSGGGNGGGGRRGLLRLSRNKRLGLKVAVLLVFGASMIAMALVLNTR